MDGYLKTRISNFWTDFSSPFPSVVAKPSFCVQFALAPDINLHKCQCENLQSWLFIFLVYIPTMNKPTLVKKTKEEEKTFGHLLFTFSSKGSKYS